MALGGRFLIFYFFLLVEAAILLHLVIIKFLSVTGKMITKAAVILVQCSVLYCLHNTY